MWFCLFLHRKYDTWIMGWYILGYLDLFFLFFWVLGYWDCDTLVRELWVLFSFLVFQLCNNILVIKKKVEDGYSEYHNWFYWVWNGNFSWPFSWLLPFHLLPINSCQGLFSFVFVFCCFYCTLQLVIIFIIMCYETYIVVLWFF